MLYEKYIIKKGTLLYRYINKPLSEVKLGMTRNKGRDGRCNRNNDIYYCALSESSILQENMGKSLCGSLIISEVQEDIECGSIVDENKIAVFRGRTANEPRFNVHEVLKACNLDIVTTYRETNNIAQDIIKYYPDGFVYPSVNSLDTIINDIRFVLDETEMYNVALTEQGYNKIYEYKLIEYKNKGWHEEKHFTAEELLKDNE